MIGLLRKVAGGGAISALIDGGVKLIVAKGETQQIIAYAQAITEIAKASWRPMLARGLAIVCVIYFSVFIGFLIYCVVPIGPSFASANAKAFIAEMKWIGELLITLSMLVFGLYIPGRSLENSTNPDGGSILETIKGVFRPSEPKTNKRRALKRKRPAHELIEREKAEFHDKPLEKIPGVVYPDQREAEPQELDTSPVKKNGFVFGKQSKGELSTVYVDLRTLAKRALEITVFDFTVYDGKRTQEEQAEEYANENSGTLNSRHLYGYAIDIMAWDENNQKTWEPRYYHEIYKAFEQASKELGIPFKWGGHMVIVRGTKKYRDYVHFELDREHYPDDQRLVA